MQRTKVQLTPAGLRPCGACVHGGYNTGRKHCHLCQVMGLYTPTPEEEAERAKRRKANREAEKKNRLEGDLK